VGVMAAVLVELGFTPAEGTGVAILSTMPGVVAHISEELQSRRPIRIVPRDQVDYDVAAGKDLSADWAEAGWPDDNQQDDKAPKPDQYQQVN
jgi:citrate synthase